MNEQPDNNSAIITSTSPPSTTITTESVVKKAEVVVPMPVTRHPTDLTHRCANGDDEHPQSFLSKGNKSFINKRFVCAISEYSLGLEMLERSKQRQEEESITPAESQPIKSDNRNNENCELHENANCNSDASTNENTSDSLFLDLLSNRALAYISIGNYLAALADTRKVLAVSPTHFKASLRQAKALAGLARYENAINCVRRSIKLLLNSAQLDCDSKQGRAKAQAFKEQVKELNLYLEKLKWMKHQAETGNCYDVPGIMDKPFEPTPSDWVDYIGQVKVQNFEGKGRGLVAAQDIPASKLVLACRAFEIIFLDGETNPEESLSEESKMALASGDFKIEDDRTLNLLARKVYDRLVTNPEKRPDFYQLHAGNELGHLEKCSVNPDEPPDMARIYGICRTNTFANAGDSYPEVEKSVGIWLFPAFVNHLCIGGNCTWKIFGDFIFVRTYRAVKKGEELVHSYVSPAFPFKARTEVLTKRLGFICSCVLCELDRKLEPSVHEEKLKLKQLVQNQDVKFSQLEISQNSEEYKKQVGASILLLEQIIMKLEKIQPNHGLYNVSLHDPLQKLGLKYFGIGKLQNAVKILERAIAQLKICLLPHAVADCCLWIIAAYIQLGDKKQGKKWAKILKDNLLLAYGDVDVLRVLGPWIIDPLKEWGLL